MALGVMYPALFPESSLINYHHQALADARMLRHVVRLFEPVFQKGSESEFARKTLQEKLQKSIAQHREQYREDDTVE